MTIPATPSELQASLSGEVITADHAEYDETRAVFYPGHDKHPAAIIRAANETDVAAAVNYAREAGLELAVRSGGHSIAGHGETEGALPQRPLGVAA